MKEKVYVILPVHNRHQITRRFIKCLKSQTYQNYHLILVDDGSTDGTEKMVRSQIHSLTVIRGKGDWWWAGGLQQGINWLKRTAVDAADIILTINDDVTFNELFLETAVAILQDKQNTLVLAQAFGTKTGRLVGAGMKADLKFLTFELATSPDEVNCLATRGLFLRFSDLVSIGDFYPNILPHYLSDYEFTIRAYKKKFNLLVCPELKLWLDEDSTGIADFSELRVGDFFKKYFSKKSKTNPLFWSAFTILACPKTWIPINLARIWKGAAIKVTARVINNFFPDSKGKIKSFIPFK